MVYIFEGFDGTGKTKTISDIVTRLEEEGISNYEVVKYLKPRTFVEFNDSRVDFLTKVTDPNNMNTIFLFDRLPDISQHVYGRYQAEGQNIPTIQREDVRDALLIPHQVVIFGFTGKPFEDTVKPKKKHHKTQEDCDIANDNREIMRYKYQQLFSWLAGEFMKLDKAPRYVVPCLTETHISTVISSVVNHALADKKARDEAISKSKEV